MHIGRRHACLRLESERQTEKLRRHSLRADAVERHRHVGGLPGPAYEIFHTLQGIQLCHFGNRGGSTHRLRLFLGREIEQGGLRLLRRLGARSRLKLVPAAELGGETLELQFAEYGEQGVHIGLAAAQIVGSDAHGDVGGYRHKLFRHLNLAGIVLYLVLQRPPQRGGIGKKILHGTVLPYQLHGCFLAHAGAAGHIVGGIAFEREQVDNLPWRRDAVALAYLLGASDLEALTLYGRAVHKHAVGDELPVVLVRSHHIGDEAFGLGHTRERAYHIVGLVALDFYHRYAVGLQYLLYVRYGDSYVFRLLVATGLILRVLLVTERMAVGRVETNGYIPRIFLAQHIFESEAEAENRRSVKTRGGNSR